jgi:7-cyano-7-deazaguanine synthase in queuosine biosynthesis
MGGTDRKKDIIVWSGGLDSTAAILWYVWRGLPFDTAYLAWSNLGQKKKEGEMAAREKMKEHIEQTYGIEWKDRVMTVPDFFLNPPVVGKLWQPVAWAFGLGIGISQDWDYGKIAMGYIKGDCFWHVREHFERLFHEIVMTSSVRLCECPEWKLPGFAYPVEWQDKRSLVKTMNDDAKTKDLLRMVWTCEYGFEGVQCGTCMTCVALSEALVANGLDPIPKGPVEIDEG